MNNSYYNIKQNNLYLQSCEEDFCLGLVVDYNKSVQL